MSTLEDRVRDAYTVVDDWGTEMPRPLPVPERRAAFRWAAPLAVAAALAAVVSGITLMVGDSKERADTRPPALAPKQAGPKFYVTVGEDSNSTKAQVRDAATGKVRGTLPPAPKGQSYGAVAAAGDNRTFFITSFEQRTCRSRFVRFAVNDSGTIVRSSSVGAGDPVRGIVMNNSLAATADGSKLAYGIGDCSEIGPVRPELGVLNVADGKRRTWSSQRPAQAVSPSWSADGKTLGFHFLIGTGVPAGSDYTKKVQVRALDTTAPGDDIFAARLILTQQERIGKIADAVLAPDGRTVYAWLQPVKWGVRAPAKEALVEFADGKPVRVLVARPLGQDGGGILKIDASGRHLLIERVGFTGRVDDGRYRDIPRAWPDGAQYAW